jgi:hypothetical protein
VDDLEDQVVKTFDTLERWGFEPDRDDLDESVRKALIQMWELHRKPHRANYRCTRCDVTYGADGVWLYHFQGHGFFHEPGDNAAFIDFITAHIKHVHNGKGAFVPVRD